MLWQGYYLALPIKIITRAQYEKMNRDFAELYEENQVVKRRLRAALDTVASLKQRRLYDTYRNDSRN